MATQPIFLLHADGTDGSTTFVNSGIDPTIGFTRKGTARISTVQKKWGTGSLIFDNTASVLELTENNSSAGIALDSGDFTLEAWIYPTITSGARTIAARWQNQSFTFSIFNGTMSFVWAPFSTAVGFMAGGVTVPVNQWSHVAVTRQGNVWCIWQNGVRVATATTATNATPNSTGVPMTVGAYYISPNSPTGQFQGYIDEIRIIRGEAVYTGTTYTVPTGPFTVEYQAAPVTRAALEVVTSGAGTAPQPSMFMVTESILLAPPLDLNVRQAALEIVSSPPAGQIEQSMFMVTESVLIAQPTDGTVRKVSLEIVSADTVGDQDVSLYSVNESVLLSLPTGRVSRVTMEIVAASDFVPPTNIQQVVWFTTS